MYITFFASILWPSNPSPFGHSQSIQNYTPKGKVNTVSSSQEHSTIDKVGCGKLKAEKSCLCVENHVFTSEEYECKVKNSREHEVTCFSD